MLGERGCGELTSSTVQGTGRATGRIYDPAEGQHSGMLACSEEADCGA